MIRNVEQASQLVTLHYLHYSM